LAHYKECFVQAQKRGYIFLTLENYAKHRLSLDKKQKIIVMRHDIDHKLSLAENLASIESELGIQATYFVRLHASYNPHEFTQYTLLKKLMEMKHEVGFHYDAGFADLFGEKPEGFFKRDKEIFERIINKKISGVSCHEPINSKGSFLISDENLADYGLTYHAYSPIFTQDLKYISDSSARWREGCMCNFIEKDTPKLCILTHPLWWHRESPSENY